MNDFWKWQVRYRIARWLIHIGFMVWPESRSKRDLLALTKDWSQEIY